MRSSVWCVTFGALAIGAGEAFAQTEKAVPVSTPAQAEPGADCSALFAPIVQKHRVPAIGGAIVTRDGIEAIGVAGVRIRGGKEAATIDDLWHLGSCTKAMTATLIGVLVDEGVLRWDMTLAEAFPELVPSANDAYRKVTIELLLTHRAGVPGDLRADGLWGRLWTHPGTPVEQRRTLTEEVLKKAPVHAPATKYQYANAGYAIAGHIAETKTGVAWEELITKKLFAPLGITSAGFGAPGVAGKADQPRGHRDAGRAVEPGKGADNPAAIGPGGTAHMSMTDWAKFIRLHLNAGAGRPELISAPVFAKLHAPFVGDGERYAMGWGVTERPWGGTVLTHSGSNTMWYCVTWISPSKEFAVLVVSNQGGSVAAKACDEAAWGLIQRHIKGGKP